jgi:hypothetical protein
LDLYENEVAKVTDQVFATYLVYLVFFKGILVDFSEVMVALYLENPIAAAKSIYPVLEAFQSQDVFSCVSQSITRAWPAFSEDERTYLSFLQAFWFVRPDATLEFVQDQIQQLPHTNLESVTFNLDPNFSGAQPPILELIEAFRGATPEHFRSAIQLLFEYVNRRPDHLPNVMSILVRRFGFEHDSYLKRYIYETTTVQEIVDQVQTSPNPLNVGIFLNVCAEYLRASHFETRAESESTLRSYTFTLQPTPELLALRSSIWNELFELFEKPHLAIRILEFIRSYANDRVVGASPELAKEDATYLVRFFTERLDPSLYLHCQVVYDFLESLDAIGVQISTDLRDQFQHPMLGLAALLCGDQFARRDLSWTERQSALLLELDTVARACTEEDFASILSQITEIDALCNQRQQTTLRHRFVILLLRLADINAALFVHALTQYLGSGDHLSLYPLALVSRLTQITGVESVHQLLLQKQFLHKDAWLGAFYSSLLPADVNEDHIAELLALIASAPLHALPQQFDFLKNYQLCRPSIFADVARLLLNRVDRDQASFLFERLLLINDGEAVDRIRDLGSDWDLVSQAYFSAIEHDNHTDYNARYLNLLLDLKPGFEIEYVEWLVEHERHWYFGVSHRDYGVLWLRPDHTELLSRIVKHLGSRSREASYFTYAPLKSFFIRPGANVELTGAIETAVYDFLILLIAENNQNEWLMKVVFEIADEAIPKRKRELIAHFLTHNKDIDDFQNLPLFRRRMSSWGSSIPEHEARISFLESLLPLLPGARFIKHSAYVNREIEFWQQQIREEMRRSFANPFE